MQLRHVFSIGLGLAMLTAASAASAATGPADSGSSAGRYTKALNTLEAKGYTNFSNFHRTGDVFQAQVKIKGKTMMVTVDPDTGLVQTAL